MLHVSSTKYQNTPAAGVLQLIFQATSRSIALSDTESSSSSFFELTAVSLQALKNTSDAFLGGWFPLAFDQ